MNSLNKPSNISSESGRARCAGDHGELWFVNARGSTNLPDFHKTATLPKRPEAILGSVALLTGRDHKDGLGGLRAVLFTLAWILVGASSVVWGYPLPPCTRSNGIIILPRFSRQGIDFKYIIGKVLSAWELMAIFRPSRFGSCAKYSIYES